VEPITSHHDASVWSGAEPFEGKSMVRTMIDSVLRYVPEREEGQAMVEYGMALLGVAILVLVVLFALGARLNEFFTVVGASLKSS
jgi:Flp pilus assembly pilin Flp